MDMVQIDRSALPLEEHEAADAIERNIIHLHMAAEEFQRTVELYLFAHNWKITLPHNQSDHIRRLVSWMGTAGRGGAIVAYGAWMAMQSMNSAKAATIASRLDLQERKKATKLFAQEFPAIAAIRTAAAHPGELSKSNAELAKHRLRPDEGPLSFPIQASGQIFVEHSLHACDDHLTYSSSFQGKLVSYELSLSKATVLKQVAKFYTSAYAPLEDATSTLWRTSK